MNFAVVGIVFKENKVLLLKRNFEPLCWCPPCGRLEPGEGLEDGIKREVFEECGIDVNVIMPVETNVVMHGGKKLNSITYVCEAISENVILSHEHSDFMWISIENLDCCEVETDFEIKGWPLLIETALFFKKIRKDFCEQRDRSKNTNR